MAVVSTGQITIVDNNDARPISAYLAVTPGLQQAYGKDNDTEAWTPNWKTGSPLVISARAFIAAVGGAASIIGGITATANHTWKVGGVAIPKGSALTIAGSPLASYFIGDAGYTYTTVNNSTDITLSIGSNILSTVSQVPIDFEANYTDPSTGLVSNIVASVTLTRLAIGTNAVYVLVRGRTAIEESSTTVKNVAVITADLVRSSGVDDSITGYKWFDNNGASVINNTDAADYGFKTTAVGVFPTATVADIGTNMPDASGLTTRNTIVIKETAVNDIGVFKVEVIDNDAKTYVEYFTIYDISDPYDIRINSSTGDKLQNGVGSSVLTPVVYNGSLLVSPLTGWYFNWDPRDQAGKPAGFIDVAVTPSGAGRAVTANNTTTITLASATGFTTAKMIKVLATDGTIRYYRITAVSTNTLTVSNSFTGDYSRFSSADNPMPVASQFVGGVAFLVVGPTTLQVNGGSASSAGSVGLRQTTGASPSITITGDEIDIKGVILCSGDRPV